MIKLKKIRTRGYLENVPFLLRKNDSSNNLSSSVAERLDLSRGTFRNLGGDKAPRYRIVSTRVHVVEKIAIYDHKRQHVGFDRPRDSRLTFIGYYYRPPCITVEHRPFTSRHSNFSSALNYRIYK